MLMFKSQTVLLVSSESHNHLNNILNQVASPNIYSKHPWWWFEFSFSYLLFACKYDQKSKNGQKYQRFGV